METQHCNHMEDLKNVLRKRFIRQIIVYVSVAHESLCSLCVVWPSVSPMLLDFGLNILFYFTFFKNSIFWTWESIIFNASPLYLKVSCPPQCSHRSVSAVNSMSAQTPVRPKQCSLSACRWADFTAMSVCHGDYSCTNCTPNFRHFMLLQ